MKKLPGRTDVEDALKRLEKRMREETLMATAQALNVVYSVDEKVTNVNGRIIGINDKVKCIDDKVEDRLSFDPSDPFGRRKNGLGMPNHDRGLVPLGIPSAVLARSPCVRF